MQVCLNLGKIGSLVWYDEPPPKGSVPDFIRARVRRLRYRSRHVWILVEPDWQWMHVMNKVLPGQKKYVDDVDECSPTEIESDVEQLPVAEGNLHIFGRLQAAGLRLCRRGCAANGCKASCTQGCSGQAARRKVCG